MHATVNCKETADGAEVMIEYEDGHTVLMSVAPDSIVLQMHLGLTPVRPAPRDRGKLGLPTGCRGAGEADDIRTQAEKEPLA